MEKMTIDGVHECLLGIAKEFHRVMTENNIPYYMVGGSVLGAVRHKGFIPWDDDMDFCIKRKYYERALEVLSKELRAPYHLLTYKNNEHVIFGFAKIEDITTVGDDIRSKLPLEEKYGVNIDIFPIDRCSYDNINWNYLTIWKRVFSLKYVETTSTNKLWMIWRHFLRMFIPFDKGFFINKVENYAKSRQEGDCFATVWGRYSKDKELINEHIWGTPKLYQFENIQLFGPEKADEYLKHLYHDYMKIPPKDERFVHIDNIFKR